MGIADAYEATVIKREAKRPCTVDGLYDNLDARDAAAMDKMLSDPRMSYSRVAEIIRASGYHIGTMNVRQHMRGECSCGQSS